MKILRFDFSRMGNSLMGVLGVAAIITIIALFLVPLPGSLLDALIAGNLVCALVLLIAIFTAKETADFSLFPPLALYGIFFNLVLGLAASRLILLRGTDFNGRIIKTVASFVTFSGGVPGLSMGCLIFAALVFLFYLISIPSAAITEFTEALEELSKTVEEEPKTKKNFKNKADLYGLIDGLGRFLTGSIKVGIFISAVPVIYSIIRGTMVQSETLTGVVKIIFAINTDSILQVYLPLYLSLAIGAGIVYMIPLFLIQAAARVIVSRTYQNKRK